MIKTVKTIAEMRDIVKEWKQQGRMVGIVPTMGSLHSGHKSLIERATQENERVVVSVFVNPMQFTDAGDLANYPRSQERDVKDCEDAGAHIVFIPEPDEMYGDGFCSFIDMAGPAMGLCGGSREGHFRGVCTVVGKLFNIVTPDRAYFGKKDAQQLAVVKRMVRDLNMDVQVIGCETVRETDGLAMSSRNQRLLPEERKIATKIYDSLRKVREMVGAGELDALVLARAAEKVLREEPAIKLDYIEIVDLGSMQKVAKIEKPALCAVAVFIGKNRLIDNIELYPGGGE